MFCVRSSFFSYAFSVAAGVVIGICGPLLSSDGGQLGHAAHVVFSSGWSWAALAFCVGVMGESRMRSAILGTISLLIAVLTYYSAKASQGDFQSADLSDPTGQTMYFSWGEFFSMAAVWGFFACLLGPALGVLGNIARSGAYRLPCQLVVPFVAIIETSMRLRNEASLQSPIVATTWSVTRIVATVAVFALMAYAVFDSWRRRSSEQAQPRR